MKSIIEKILEREAQYHLCTREINGFQYWQYERFHVNKYMRQVDEPDLARDKINILQLCKYYLCNRCYTKQAQTTDICFISHPRRQFIEDHYECIYTDALAKKFSNTVTFENFFARDHLEPIASANVIYMDRPVIESELYERLMGLLKREKRVSDKIYKELSVALNGLLTHEQLREISKRGAKDYYRYQYLRMRFKKILKRMNPKLVVEVVSYVPKCMIINELCKDMGIQTIELQHGWIGRDHVAYNYAPGSVVKQFPDKIYLFGEYYKTKASFPISQDNLIITGFPYYERELQKYKERRRKDTRYTILFLSQGSYAKSLPQLAVDLRKVTDENHVRILYKLHPIEYHDWQQTSPLLLEKGIEVIGAKDMPLYECFANSDVQIGAYSTAIYEGLGFHLRTFIFEQAFADRLQDLIDLGIAEKVKSAIEIVEKIQIQDYNAYDIDYFWKRNALHNLEQTLRDELDQVMQSSSEERRER